MTFIFIDVATVRALHEQQIAHFGGSYGLRDEGLLESAVLRAENRATYDPSAGAAMIGASLAWGLIKNHAFVDGNKRIGIVSMIVFLELNGYRLTCSEVEETAMVLRAASSEIAEDEWAAWVESVVARK